MRRPLWRRCCGRFLGATCAQRRKPRPFASDPAPHCAPNRLVLCNTCVHARAPLRRCRRGRRSPRRAACAAAAALKRRAFSLRDVGGRLRQPTPCFKCFDSSTPHWRLLTHLTHTPLGGGGPLNAALPPARLTHGFGGGGAGHERAAGVRAAAAAPGERGRRRGAAFDRAGSSGSSQ